MELDELHVDQLRARVIRERMTVAGVLPAVARDLVGAADSAGREDDGLGAEDNETSPLAIVAERADDALSLLQQRQDRALHVHVDALVNSVILQRADHFESRAIADVREPRILMAAEVALQNAAVIRPVEDGAPRFELAHAIGRFLCVQLSHPPIVDVLAAAHRIGEVHPPVVAIVDVRQRGRDSAFRHHGVRFAEE